MSTVQRCVRLLVEYDGTDFHGWQVQPDVRTVEGDLTLAAWHVLGKPETRVKVQGASRTDSGVHARGQVASILHATDRSVWDFVRGLNGLTGDDLRIRHAEEVSPEFNARHSARGKIYHYVIERARYADPMRRRTSWTFGQALDLTAMCDAASRMVGRHDFAAFRAADCEAATTVREIRRVDLVEEGAFVRVEVEGTAFLKHMVRIMVGTLVDVGLGHRAPSLIDDLLVGAERKLAGQTAPARGLTLMEVFYPDFPWLERVDG